MYAHQRRFSLFQLTPTTPELLLRDIAVFRAFSAGSVGRRFRHRLSLRRPLTWSICASGHCPVMIANAT